MIVIIFCYLWNTEDAMSLCQMAVSSPNKHVCPSLNPPSEQRDYIISAASTVWEAVTRGVSNFWDVFLDWLQVRLERWLFEEIPQHYY